MDRICVVIVFFNPTVLHIQQANKLAERYKVVVVDNSTTRLKGIFDFCYLPLLENKGIAYAQNEGIRYAFSQNAEYLVFLDQDSRVEDNYPSSMLAEYHRIKSIDSEVSMVGPTIVDEKTNVNYFNNDSMTNDCVKVNSIISSGLIIDSFSIRSIGMLDDYMFIDYVDFEWCWRAIYKGYNCYKTSKVKLYHSIGSNYYHKYGFTMYVSAPIRYYYQYRNFLYLLHKKYVPMSWKFKGLIRKTIDILLLPFFVRERIKTLSFIFQGIKDGILNK